MSTTCRMPLVDALQALVDVRTEQIVITTMSAARQWPRLSQHPLDLHYIPSAMGQAPALGLGLALARPDRETIVLNGDGCMLMNLGVLVTVVASGARNFTLVVIENGVYEVTGGQRTAAAASPAGVDLAAMARAAGFTTVARFEHLAAWQAGAASILGEPGPRFVVLAVEPVRTGYQLESPGPIAPRLAQFRQALAAC